MSLIHDYIDERKARLVRLGARPCRQCEALRNEVAEKTRSFDAQAAAQSASIDAYRARIMALEAAAPAPSTTANNVADDPIYRAVNALGAALTVMNILGATCRHFGLSYADIMSPRRDMEAVLPRQIAMYLAKTLTTRSLPEIGRRIGDRDHTTILHGFRKIKALVDIGHPIIKDIDAIRSRLGAPS